jgi:hypothetical protein
VRVGNHYPPKGGEFIVGHLEDILLVANNGHASPYEVHCRYERLHPFTDGNGRSGRVLWAWQMQKQYGICKGFLHQFYYQALDASR